MHSPVPPQQDTDENRAKWKRKDDRRVIYTVVLKLNEAGSTAMRIIGQDPIAYEAAPGSGLCFLSDLWHRTEHASAGTCKLTIFFGVWL